MIDDGDGCSSSSSSSSRRRQLAGSMAVHGDAPEPDQHLWQHSWLDFSDRQARPCASIQSSMQLNSAGPLLHPVYTLQRTHCCIQYASELTTFHGMVLALWRLGPLSQGHLRLTVAIHSYGL